MSQLADQRCGDAREALPLLQRVRRQAVLVLVKPHGGAGNEGIVLEARIQNLPRHGVGQGDIGTHIQPQPGMSPTGGTGAPGIYYVKLRAAMHPLENVVEKDGVGIAGVGAPEDDQVGVFRLAIRAGAASRPEDRRQTDDARGVSRAVAAVDVIAPQHRPRELLGKKIYLIGGFGAAEETEPAAPVPLDRGLEPFGRTVERLLPRGVPQPSILPDHGPSNALMGSFHRRTSVIPKFSLV